jgi:hypothetical protein
MNDPLRPLNLGEILDRTALLYRSRFLVFIGISLIPTVVVLAPLCGLVLFFTWLGSSGATSQNQAAAVVVGLLFLLVLLLAVPVFVGVNALAAGAINQASARACQDEKITIRDAYKAAWLRGWSYLGLYVLQTLIVWVAPFVAWFVLFSLSALAAALLQKAGLPGDTFLGLAAVLVIIALFTYGIWMQLCLSLAFPACVVEEIGVGAAIKRSFSLCNGTKGRIFVLYLLGMALNTILSLGITVPLVILMYLFPWFNDPQHSQAAGGIVLLVVYGSAFAVQTFTRPVYGIALILFYYDQRIRQEGYDIEWMMQQAGLVASPTPVPEAAPWLPPIPHKPQPSAAEATVVELEAPPNQPATPAKETEATEPAPPQPGEFA